LEDKRLGRRGTIAIGAVAIIAVFMIAVTCIATLIAEYNRYVYVVKATGEKLKMKGQEKLAVEQISNKKIEVKNEGSTTSFIVGVFALSPTDNNIKYVKFGTPVDVKILTTKNINLPEAVPTGWKVAVLTAYGNIFWEES